MFAYLHVVSPLLFTYGTALFTEIKILRVSGPLRVIYTQPVISKDTIGKWLSHKGKQTDSTQLNLVHKAMVAYQLQA